ncbi:MAG: hypothetical protein IT318_23940 [Anaerolineales bacterium]|nr:hypothetical protein [Anaerolineales bacterium]
MITNPAVVFIRLIGRAAAGLPHVRLARCPRCAAVTRHVLAAETATTHESIYRCERCSRAQALQP